MLTHIQKHWYTQLFRRRRRCRFVWRCLQRRVSPRGQQPWLLRLPGSGAGQARYSSRAPQRAYQCYWRRRWSSRLPAVGFHGREPAQAVPWLHQVPCLRLEQVRTAVGLVSNDSRYFNDTWEISSNQTNESIKYFTCAMISIAVP
jgi:hypothetical protein